MRLLTLFGLAIAAVAGSSGPAGAQLQPELPLGTRIPKSLEELPVDQTSDFVRDLALCAVEKRYELARELILTVRDYYIPDKYLKLADAACLGQALVGKPYGAAQLKMSNGILRFALADALVTRDLKAYDAAGISSATPLAAPVYNVGDLTESKRRSEKERAELAARDRAEIELIKYGECVVRTDPSGAQRLLLTSVNSKAEGTALQAMMPAFGGCLNIGQEFSASRTMLRGTVALNYYRLAYAPKGPAQAAAPAEKAI